MSEEPDKLDFDHDSAGIGYSVESRVRRSGTPMKMLTVRAYFVGLNRVKVENDYHFPEHRHSDFELIVVESGPYLCRLNGVDLTVRETEALLIQAGDLHEVKLSKGQQHVVMQFSLQGSGSENSPNVDIFAPNVPVERQVIPMDRDFLEAVLSQLEQESKGSGRFSSQIQDVLMEQVFWTLMRALPSNSLSPIFLRESKDEAFMRRFCRVIEDRIGERLSLLQIARALDCSTSTVTKRCRAIAGCSAAQFSARIKVRAALRELSQTDRTIKEIGYQLGFRNPFHFSRVFKRLTGKPPSAIRTRSEDEADA